MSRTTSTSIQPHLIFHSSVGKSSLLNALLGKHVVRASRTPGKTKSLQTIYWTPEVRLVDCPGLVFPSLVGMENQVLSGVIPIQNVEAVVYELGQRMPLEEILQVEKLEEDREEMWSTDSLLAALAVQRGFLTAKAARPDLYRAGSMVIRGIQASLIPWSFRPSTASSDRNAVIEQQGIYLPLSAQLGSAEAARQRLEALHTLPEEQDQQGDGSASTEAEDEDEDEDEDDREVSEPSDAESESQSEDEAEEAGSPAAATPRAAVGGAFSLLAIDDGETDDDEEAG